MNIIRYPERREWNSLLKRSALHTEDIRETVCDMLKKIQAEGDLAVIRFEEQFDKVKLSSLEVTEKEFDDAEKAVDTASFSSLVTASFCFFVRSLYSLYVFRNLSNSSLLALCASR